MFFVQGFQMRLWLMLTWTQQWMIRWSRLAGRHQILRISESILSLFCAYCWLLLMSCNNISQCKSQYLYPSILLFIKIPISLLFCITWFLFLLRTGISSWTLRSVIEWGLPICCKMTTGRSHLQSANACLLSVPCTRTTYGDRSFAVRGPVAWNSLVDSYRDTDSYITILPSLPT